MTVRKKALRSSAEEYQKVTEVVSKYAVHNADVGIMNYYCFIIKL